MASIDYQVRPHRGFINAVYLLACFFTTLEDPATTPSLMEYEALFLARSQAGLSEALSLSDRLLDFVHGSNLIAAYLFLRNRPIEGYVLPLSLRCKADKFSRSYHTLCGTARFALACGLHRITSHTVNNANTQPGDNVISLLDPPKTQLEVGEHILLFWQTVWWDRVSSIIWGYIPALPSPEIGRTILPKDMEYYENVSYSMCKQSRAADRRS